ncbi:hypothetical protein NJB14197_14270 [Mycobacterium montefiorense]|uniref:Uncharacterized protein n=1 Tax=Mycobacterium montefiorense TaxID=154654 RepID=A0AA37PLC9_9MYCO|nr:hypothetical protein MmonteBS_44350 [Mycobacterium montefiorense]GKU33576.1 hypothetical protein NJB14191_09230 [Mycobacterium montefiorense]GKU39514.1 hypothetical protein NJB14192_15070 [Mycobacterium montefiorense]GKU43791.1 hypothetical protein NJB14194_04240 [Mycobacterium montefiorense]GKU52717.1 hypothetical protein NJB14195_39590 [Mycobacterium montefiorense]
MSATLGGIAGLAIADSGPGLGWPPQPLSRSAAPAATAAAHLLSVATIVAMLEGCAAQGVGRLRPTGPVSVIRLTIAVRIVTPGRLAVSQGHKSRENRRQK